jgi:hypothetical protein
MASSLRRTFQLVEITQLSASLLHITNKGSHLQLYYGIVSLYSGYILDLSFPGCIKDSIVSCSTLVSFL